jgi:uncharacterized protein YdaU (DUF1376 family)
MHYYQFNIGDYAKSTKHLTLLEDLAYRRLLDIYYDTEKPLNSNVKQLARIAGMSAHTDEITNVLADFFTETEEGFTQKKAACEIEAYQAKAGTARVNGKLGGRPKKTQPEPKETQSVNSANPDETGLQGNYKPLTTNYKPTTINQEPVVEDHIYSTLPKKGIFSLSQSTKIPRDFPINKEMKDWALHENITADLESETTQFVDHFTSKGEARENWLPAWRFWMRNTLKYNQKKPNDKYEKDIQALQNWSPE